MLGSPGVGCVGVAVASSILCAWSAAQPIPHQLLPMQKINETKKIQNIKKIFGVGGSVNGPIHFSIPTYGQSLIL